MRLLRGVCLGSWHYVKMQTLGRHIRQRHPQKTLQQQARHTACLSGGWAGSGLCACQNCHNASCGAQRPAEGTSAHGHSPVTVEHACICEPRVVLMLIGLYWTACGSEQDSACKQVPGLYVSGCDTELSPASGQPVATSQCSGNCGWVE